jgi:16S rRNA (adenine1518-N6/adenine1519-N6)-dimethyltransferase
MNAAEVREVLARLGVRPSRRRGQRFLVDDDVARRQVAHAAPRPGERVLEIGPGLGILTGLLLEASDRVVVVERDRRLARYLRHRFPEAEVVEGDVLAVDLPPFDVCVSNLPYQISSAVTFRLLASSFDRAVLMYQREFAERMAALPGRAGYSRLSVKVYAKAACRVLERVPRQAFYPPPDVDSAVVALRVRRPPFELEDPVLFDALVDVVFQHRRKTVRNGLLLGARRLGWTTASLRKAFPSLPYLDRRPETLDPGDLAHLANRLATAKS